MWRRIANWFNDWRKAWREAEQAEGWVIGEEW